MQPNLNFIEEVLLYDFETPQLVLALDQVDVRVALEGLFGLDPLEVLLERGVVEHEIEVQRVRVVTKRKSSENSECFNIKS